MNMRTNLAALALGAVLLSTSSFAQLARPGRLNPPHLNEMPLVERVQREITAPNPQDAPARLAGAFEQLSEIIEELSGGRTAVGRQTPDEDRIMGEYRTARSTILQKVLGNSIDQVAFAAMRRFDEDPALREELVNKFFSPALRAQSMAISRELQARRAAMRQQQTAFGGQAIARPAAPSAAPAPAPAPAKALPPDPSVAKARAANVDTKVFGLQLGEPVSLPACGLLGMVATSSNCLVSSEISGIASALIGAMSSDGNAPELAIIQLTANNCPTWMSECRIIGTLDNGRLISAAVHPDGHKVEKDVAQELRGKYGTRFSAQQRFITPDNGSAKFEVWDLTWEFPGMRVEYRVVEETIYRGLLRIETEAAYSRRMAVEKEAKRPRL